MPACLRARGQCPRWVIRDRGRVSSKSGYVRSAPKATELLRRHEMTRWPQRLGAELLARYRPNREADAKLIFAGPH
jgi:hypothetical protein